MTKGRKEKNSLTRVLLSGPPLFGEFMLGIFALVWGLWLILPMESFQTSIMYYSLSKMLPEPTWGVMMLGVGFIKLFGLFENRHFMRRGGAALATLLWFFVSVVLAFDAPANPGFISYLLLAIFSAINYARLSRGADDERRD